jgi:hypothetical protein
VIFGWRLITLLWWEGSDEPPTPRGNDTFLEEVVMNIMNSEQPLRRYCFDAERIDQTRTPGPGDRCVLFVAPRGLALTNRASLRIGGVYAEDIM